MNQTRLKMMDYPKMAKSKTRTHLIILRQLVLTLNKFNKFNRISTNKRRGDCKSHRACLYDPAYPVSQEIWPPRAIFLRKFAPPWGTYFLGNMSPSSEIWPPRKHSLLHCFKLGNREAFSKMKMLKVFVSNYG